MNLSNVSRPNACAAFSHAIDLISIEYRVKKKVIAEVSGIGIDAFNRVKHGGLTPDMEIHIQPIEAAYPGFIKAMETELDRIQGRTTGEAAGESSTLVSLDAKADRMLELMIKERDRYRDKFEALQEEVKQMLIDQILKKD